MKNKKEVEVVEVVEVVAPVKVVSEKRPVPEKIYPGLVPGTRIQIIATAKIYDVVFHEKTNMYEFVHKNYYQNVLKTEQQVANLINTRKLIVIENEDGNAWAYISGPPGEKKI